MIMALGVTVCVCGGGGLGLARLPWALRNGVVCPAQGPLAGATVRLALTLVTCDPYHAHTAIFTIAGLCVVPCYGVCRSSCEVWPRRLHWLCAVTVVPVVQTVQPPRHWQWAGAGTVPAPPGGPGRAA